jgi:hypothetical protein
MFGLIYRPPYEFQWEESQLREAQEGGGWGVWRTSKKQWQSICVIVSQWPSSVYTVQYLVNANQCALHTHYVETRVDDPDSLYTGPDPARSLGSEYKSILELKKSL